MENVKFENIKINSGCCCPVYTAHNNEKLTGLHAGGGFDIAGVATFSSGGETLP